MELSKFNIKSYDLGQNIFILGGKRSGKTTLIKELLDNRTTVLWTACPQEYSCKLLHSESTTFCSTQGCALIHNSLNDFPNVIQNFKRANRPWTNVVIDDILEEPDGIMSDEPCTDRRKRWEYENYTGDLFRHCRLWKMNFILASRYNLIQQRSLLVCLGYVFIFPDTIRGDLKRLQATFRYYLRNRDLISSEEYEECMNFLEDGHPLVIDYRQGKLYYYSNTQQNI